MAVGKRVKIEGSVWCLSEGSKGGREREKRAVTDRGGERGREGEQCQ